jgi:hypothetical protein
MSNSKQTAGTGASPATGEGDGRDTPGEKNSGRVAFDARGNAIWEWRTGEAGFDRDASTTQVQKLEAPGLSIEATRKVQRAAVAQPVSHERTPDRVESATLAHRTETPELSLEATMKVKRPEVQSPDKTALAGGGFNPYDRNGGAAAKSAVSAARPTRPPTRPDAQAPREPASALARVREWLGGRGRQGRR